MDEFIKALTLIQEECKKYNSCGCNLCPFGTYEGECCICNRTPKHWKITEPQSVVRVMNGR